MIIVMKSGASRADIDRVCGKVEARGLKTHLSEGEDRTVIGVIGHDPFSVKDAFTHDPSVEEVVRITRPYKLSGREFRSADTVVRLGNGLTISGNVIHDDDSNNHPALEITPLKAIALMVDSDIHDMAIAMARKPRKTIACLIAHGCIEPPAAE